MASLQRDLQSLVKGKTWFFKWPKRYKLDGSGWPKEHSKKSVKSPRIIGKVMEEMFIATRKKLQEKLYM